MATITKRGQRWSVQIRRSGSPAQFRTLSSRREAAAWAAIEEARLDRGELPVPHQLLRATTLGDLIDRYLTDVTPRKQSASTEELRLKKLRQDVVCAVGLDRLSPGDIASYRDRRSALVAAGTVRRELSLIHHAIELGRNEWGYRLPVNPVKEIALPKLRNSRDRRLEKGELERLFSAASAARNPLFWPIISFAIETAMRRGELLNLTWNCVDLDKRTAFIPRTKTGWARTIPLTDGAMAILLNRPSRSGRVFPASADSLKLGWGRIVRRAELEDLHFHDLRHEAISRFFEMGLSLPEVAIISGHRDTRMLMRYTHLRPAELAQKLAGRVWSGGSAANDVMAGNAVAA